MAKKSSKSVPVPPAPPAAPVPPKKFTATCMCSPTELPDSIAEAATELQNHLKKDVWFLVEGAQFTLAPWMYYRLRNVKNAMAGRDVALVINSWGGSALAAYRIATLFQKNAKSFTVVVPRIAKSAGTLLALGADEIILGEDAELGPLDAQFEDHDTEEDLVSALDMVQAIEQLEESAIEVAMRMLKSLRDRTKKRVNLLLEPSLSFAAEVTKPLFEKIDAVSFSRNHRMLKEAEDYAIRLLSRRRFARQEAEALARDLVKRYSTHGFVIDLDECETLGIIRNEEGKETSCVGLHAKKPPNSSVASAIEKLYKSPIEQITALGKLDTI